MSSRILHLLIEPHKNVSTRRERITAYNTASTALLLFFLILILALIASNQAELQFILQPGILYPLAGIFLLSYALSRSKWGCYGAYTLIIGSELFLLAQFILTADTGYPILILLLTSLPVLLVPRLQLPPFISLWLAGISATVMACFPLFLPTITIGTVALPVAFIIFSALTTWGFANQIIRHRCDLEIQANSLQQLYRFSLAWVQASDPDSFMKQAISILGKSFPGSQVSILLPDEKNTNLRGAVSGEYDEFEEEGLIISVTEGLTGWSFTNAETVRVNDVLKDPRYIEKNPGSRSEMCIPLKDGDSIVGIINLESPVVNGYSLQDQQFAETLAPLLTGFLMNAQLQRARKNLLEFTDDILDSAPAGMICYQQDGSCSYANHALGELIGYSTDRIAQTSLQDLNFWQSINVLDRINRARERMVSDMAEVLFSSVDGRNIELTILIQPFFSQDETQTLILVMDNTFQSATQEELNNEREFIETILDNAGALIVVVDPQGTIIRFNTACETLTGYSSEEVIGRTTADVFLLSEKIRVLPEPVPGFDDSRPTVEYVNHWRMKDGSLRLIAWSNTAARRADDTLEYVISVGSDITAAQATAERLRVTAAAIESAANGIVITNREGVIEWVNESFCQLTGYSTKEVIGQNPRILNSGLQDPAYYKELWDTILSGNVWRGKIRNRRKDGTIYTEEMTITPVRNEQDTITHFIAIKLDVTENELAERALRESETRFRAFIEGAAVGILIGDPQGRFIESNQAFQSMTGYSADELRNLRMLDIIHPGDEKPFDHLYEALFKGERSQFNTEIRLIRNNAQTFWVNISPALVRNAEGEPVFAIMIIEDTSDRKWAEEALQQSERRLQQITNAIEQCIYSYNIEKNGSLSNPLITPSIRLFTGFPPEEHFRNPGLWMERIHPDDLEHVEIKLNPLSAGKDRYFLVYRVLDRDQNIRWVKDDIVFTRNENGVITRMDGILTDISELKKAHSTLEERNQALQEANLQLKELDRMKSNFLANISHELRTPLNSIIGFAEIMQDGLVGELNGQQLEFTTDIHSSGKHLLKLINNILDLSKIEAGSFRIRPEPFNFNELAEETVDSVRQLFGSKNQQLILNPFHEIPTIVGDRFRLKQVLLNLLSNANKFTPEDGQITLQAEIADDTTLLVNVIDNGIGIAIADANAVFEEFHQVDSSASREAQGTGLGLPISKRIIEMHGGRIWFESNPGEGCTFSFLLPVQGLNQMHGYPHQDPDPLTSLSDDPTPTVLIVEDDKRCANLLAFHLNHAGIETIDIPSGELALNYAKQLQPNLITIDLILPNMDGWQVLEKLKQDAETAHIPVVMVSVPDDTRVDPGKWQQMGAAGYLTKPITHADVRRILDQLHLHPQE